ncbi:MAG TPA: hypothetical protein VMX16_10960 [Terriglobia bacterium]|nr:hypothetical protein [Terriglobia bacterium]
MSRLRRLILSDRYFFVTCNLLRTKKLLNDDDFEILARGHAGPAEREFKLGL